MNFRSLVGAVLLSTSLFHAPAFAETKDWTDKGWDFVGDKDGIKSFRKSHEGSPVKGVGGEAIIDAPIGKILWVLMDHEHKNQWIDKFKEARTLEEVSPLIHVQHASFDMPFPVADREFVYTYNFRVDTALNAVIVDVKSTDSAKSPAPAEGIVRGEIVDGRYILKPMGDKTFVQAEYLADAKGSLPVWIVNMIQKKWPHKTLEGLRLQVKKDFVKTWSYYDSELKPKLKLN